MIVVSDYDLIASGCAFQPLRISNSHSKRAGRGVGRSKTKYKLRLARARLKFGSDTAQIGKWVSWNAAALMLGVCDKTLRRWSRARLIPKRLVTSDVDLIYRAMHNLGRIEN